MKMRNWLANLVSNGEDSDVQNGQTADQQQDDGEEVMSLEEVREETDGLDLDQLSKNNDVEEEQGEQSHEEEDDVVDVSQVRSVEDVIDPDDKVLGTELTWSQFQEEIENREDLIEALRHDTEYHNQRFEAHVERAKEASGDKKEKYAEKAKEQEINHNSKQNILENLRRQKMVLKWMKMQHMENVAAKPEQILPGIDLAMEDIPVDAVSDAVKDASFDRKQQTQQLDDLVEELSDISEDVQGPDLSSVFTEIEALEAQDVEEKSLDLEDALAVQEGGEAEAEDLEEELEELEEA